MSKNDPLCLALGLGAIGKAVSGYAMTKAGVYVTFADILESQIQSINREKGYWIGTADINTKQLSKEFITNVNALHVKSSETKDVAIKADYIISAVGSEGFRVLLPEVISWLQARHDVTDAPLYYMIFENDHAAVLLLQNAVWEAFGAWPEWLHIAKCSIERMAKLVDTRDYGKIAIAENFFPIIAERSSMEGCGIFDCQDVIEMVDNVERYYFRKLLTNNLGHAVLGYAGYPRGYRNTLEAMADPEIYTLLRDTLYESGKAVCAKWKFTTDHMKRHIDTLMLRYANPGLVDDLERLTRDPVRKLTPDERIVLPINLCYQNNIKPINLLKTLFHAIRYTNPRAERGQELIELRRSIGEAGVLKTLCKADNLFLKDAMSMVGSR